MPRRQTPAHERTEQNRRLKQRVEAETGIVHSRAAAEDHVRNKRTTTGGKPTKSAAATGSTYAVPDRTVDFPADALTPFGRFLGRITDKRETLAYCQVTIVAHPTHGHLLHDALMLSGHPFLITLEQIYAPAPELEPDDA